MSEAELKPATTVPVKDPIVDRVYDYTKWHIALHAAILVVIANGNLAAKGDRYPWYISLAVFFVGIAGVAAGTVASCLSRRESWEGFLQTRTFPLLSDERSVGLTMQMWIHLQHFGLWAAIIVGLGGALIHSWGS